MKGYEFQKDCPAEADRKMTEADLKYEVGPKEKNHVNFKISQRN